MINLNGEINSGLKKTTQ